MSATQPPALIDGAVLPTLARLAVPNIAAMSMAVAIGVVEIWSIGRLGTTPLAAMAVVFPFAMLTQMMSAGAMGGGVSSAVARALGANDDARATRLAQHALMIGSVAGIVNLAVMLLVGRALFAALGARGEVLEQSVAYANVLFLGAPLVWSMNTLASIMRGTGDMRGPSQMLFVTALLQIALCLALTLGFGPLPALGLRGVALAAILASVAGVAICLRALRSPHARVRLTWPLASVDGALMRDILRVGALACLSPLQSVLTAILTTAFVARVGVTALAGYGIGQRLEFMLIPIAFGVGVASVPMVGMAIGGGLVARARRVAWTAAFMSAANVGIIGLIVAIAPALWARWFSSDAAVLDSAAQYLRWAGPAFAFYGLGLTLYFASQGAGRVLGPVLAGTVRLVVVVAGGLLLAANDAPAGAYFALVGAGMVAYGVATALAVRFTPWRTGGPARAT